MDESLVDVDIELSRAMQLIDSDGGVGTARAADIHLDPDGS